jgi:hypothetical protein
MHTLGSEVQLATVDHDLEPVALAGSREVPDQPLPAGLEAKSVGLAKARRAQRSCRESRAAPFGEQRP